MDWECYKRLCDRPDIWSRWMLEQTLELLDQTEMSKPIRRAMVRAPIAKPEDHRGGGATDMFELTLTSTEVNMVSELVVAAIAGGKTTTGTKNRGFGGFREAWEEYRRFLES
ncbi:MAG: hypothetical protein O7E57_15070 [Gammaproteobacteria bacterium]|nr:hypothetical protein [Gammaproteobacteria bacterium]